MQANLQHSGSLGTVLSYPPPDDDVAVFANHSRLLDPKQPLISPVSTPRPSASKLNHSGQVGVHTRPSDSLEHPLLPHQPPLNKQAFLPGPDNYLDNFQPTFSDLSGGWDGLFHEVPQPSFNFGSNSTSYPMHLSGEGAMLDDRWASFVHNYSAITEPSQRQNPHAN
jgi:hypothetical protein